MVKVELSESVDVIVAVPCATVIAQFPADGVVPVTQTRTSEFE